ncbi:hypothetical protein PMI15_04708 [Polaromonas sp. CF318]|uniref:hypothetical protein n=1 Tax=Polaromonas sp. CF318 TaxID=1144318 RepID=UPI0002714CD9|nr:hypothetical protein [Polaromonas sp. CF318]EJL77386.1 hypothetical protein PMI15_04708 [Polaromonas sp. CF318]
MPTHNAGIRLNKPISRLLAILASAFLLFAGDASANPPEPKPSPGSQKDCSLLSEINYNNHDEAVSYLRQLYQTSNFGDLDATLTCLLRDSKRFQSGKTGASAAYWFFRREMPAPGVEAGQGARVKEWQKQKPDSIFPAFANLRLQYALAWNARGSSYAKDVPGGGMQSFQQGLLQTEKSLLEARKEFQQTPIWQNLLLAVSLDAAEGKSDPNSIFEEGAKRWPNYYDFYEVALTRLVPKWGGSWEVVDAFIVGWAKQLQASEGESLYARLYASVVFSGAAPSETRLDWPRMKRSLDDLIKRYPDPVHKNWAAALACAHGDSAYYKVSMQRIGAQEIRPQAWIRGTDPTSCSR